MFILHFLRILFLLILFIPACARTDDKQPQATPTFNQVQQIEEVKPEKPAKIKLKRDAKDDYSWEISGDNVDEIIRADKRLKKDLKTE